jgi:VWFA-related protein
MRPELLAALFLCSSIWAADTPERLIKLNVAMVDTRGEQVTDLTSADIQVFEDGKPKSILFSRFTGRKSAQVALAPREYSNRSDLPRPTVVILLDMLNGRVLTDAADRDEIVDALKKTELGDNIYLYLLTPRGELFPVHPLPLPNTEIKPQAEPWTLQIASILDQAMKPFVSFRPVDEYDLKERFQQTLKALIDLGSRMTEVEGRKNLVWVTEGFPMFGYSISLRTRVDFTTPLREFYQRLALAQIVVYPSEQSRAGSGAFPGSLSLRSLQEAADLTGGRLLTRVGDSIARALTDSLASYEIVYSTSAEKSDGKRHKIQVSTTRKDVRAETAQGYYVLAPVSPEDQQRQAIDAAIHSPFDATDIGIRTSIVPGNDATALNLNISIDPSDVLLRKAGDDYSGHLQLVIAAYGAGGFQKVLRSISFDFKLTPAQYEVASHNGMVTRQTVSVSDSDQSVRVIVYDPSLKAAGSLRVPVKP